VVQSLGVTLGVIVGGGWAWYRFLVQRASETALSIDLVITVAPLTGSHASLVFVDTVLQNSGNRRLIASSRRPALPSEQRSNGASYVGESFPHALGLSVRRVTPKDGTLAISWESYGVKTRHDMDRDLSLLELYERTGQPFWLEPGEIIHFGEPFLLDQGHYIARVTFVGKRRGELWRRTDRFQVPVVTPENDAH